ncbi:MAG: hypothetical protein ACI8SZ_002123, partial [Colwellia sp.]
LILMSTFILKYFEKHLKEQVNLYYLALNRLDNISKQSVDDSFSMNPLELQRILKSLYFSTSTNLAFICSIINHK